MAPELAASIIPPSFSPSTASSNSYTSQRKYTVSFSQPQDLYSSIRSHWKVLGASLCRLLGRDLSNYKPQSHFSTLTAKRIQISTHISLGMIELLCQRRHCMFLVQRVSERVYLEEVRELRLPSCFSCSGVYLSHLSGRQTSASSP